jgi:hypothetical protein
MSHDLQLMLTFSWTAALTKSDFGLQRTHSLLLLTHYTVQCTLSSVRIFSPVFTVSAVTSDVYVSLLRDEFIPFLQGYSTAINTVWV